jgi:hypothetical protein
MKLENYAFLMGIIVGIVIGFVSGILYQVHTVKAENYNFNMTKELEDEGNVVALCYDTGIEIEMIKEFCATRYGGIGTEYGEAIK